jgi:hypothetical protein
VDVKKALAAMEKMTPKEGFNLVGVDDFEPPGEELFLIGHFDTKDEAEAAKAERLRENPDAVMHIYG